MGWRRTRSSIVPLLLAWIQSARCFFMLLLGISSSPTKKVTNITLEWKKKQHNFSHRLYYESRELLHINSSHVYNWRPVTQLRCKYSWSKLLMPLNTYELPSSIYASFFSSLRNCTPSLLGVYPQPQQDYLGLLFEHDSLKIQYNNSKKPWIFSSWNVSNDQIPGLGILILLIKKYISLMGQCQKIQKWDSCKIFIIHYKR